MRSVFSLRAADLLAARSIVGAALLVAFSLGCSVDDSGLAETNKKLQRDAGGTGGLAMGTGGGVGTGGVIGGGGGSNTGGVTGSGGTIIGGTGRHVGGRRGRGDRQRRCARYGRRAGDRGRDRHRRPAGDGRGAWHRRDVGDRWSDGHRRDAGDGRSRGDRRRDRNGRHACDRRSDGDRWVAGRGREDWQRRDDGHGRHRRNAVRPWHLRWMLLSRWAVCPKYLSRAMRQPGRGLRRLRPVRDLLQLRARAPEAARSIRRRSGRSSPSRPRFR